MIATTDDVMVSVTAPDRIAVSNNGAVCSRKVNHAFVPCEVPAAGTFQAIVKALDASSHSVIGPAQPRLLVIPIHDEEGAVTGGFWGATMFEWLHVGMLFVPETMRGQGVGAALMASAETEARKRGCRGAYVDTFSFQAAPFYQKLGFTLFGVLEDYPPGHRQLYFRKSFEQSHR
jgi:GNAT superfamily N-acetyltransferase